MGFGCHLRPVDVLARKVRLPSVDRGELGVWRPLPDGGCDCRVLVVEVMQALESFERRFFLLNTNLDLVNVRVEQVVR